MRPSVLERGDPVFLRRPRAGDAVEFTALVRGSRSFLRPWVYPPADATGYAGYLRRLRSGRHVGLFACRHDDEALVGIINLNEVVRGNLQSAYLGYYTAAEHAGKGYMTEALGLAVRHAFGTLGLHRLEANIQPQNTRSIALVQRCGFRREGFSPRYLKIGGRWKDHERWALLADEWRLRTN